MLCRLVCKRRVYRPKNISLYSMQAKCSKAVLHVPEHGHLWWFADCLLLYRWLQVEGTVNVRTRDNVVHGMHRLEDVKQLLAQERNNRSLTSVFGSGSSSADGQQHQQPPADS